MSLVVTRFAPSPTGDLHVGGAYTALFSWLVARTSGGKVLLRIEDLDTPRVVPGAAERLREDLLWLGLSWDEEQPPQSTRSAAYAAALTRLEEQGLVYLCDCSRAEIGGASAPHAGEEIRYPGLCQAKSPQRTMRRPPATRVRVPDAAIEGVDELHGCYMQNLQKEVGDFVLRRGDGIYSYQLAVVVDDAAGGVSDVVRGDDLLASTPRQRFLCDKLGVPIARTWHLPLVVAPDGRRLEKRATKISIRALRERGVSSEAVVGALAQALGIAHSDAPKHASELVPLGLGPRAKHSWSPPSSWT